MDVSGYYYFERCIWALLNVFEYYYFWELYLSCFGCFWILEFWEIYSYMSYFRCFLILLFWKIYLDVSGLLFWLLYTWAVLDVSGYSMMFQTVVLILPILNINQPWVKLQIGLGNTIKKNLFTLVFKQVNRKQTAVYRLYLMKKPLQSVYLTHFLKLTRLRLLLLNLS